MKIGYTYQGINQKVGGVSRYFYEICSRLHNRHSLIFITKFKKNLYFENILSEKKNFLPRLKFKGKWLIEELIQINYTRKSVRRHTFDIIHHTGEFTQIFDYRKSATPIIVTIHDMTPELMYKSDSKRLNNRKCCIEQSSAIICVSENTRSDLFRFYPYIDKAKVFVIYHGISTETVQYLKNCSRKYILYVGSRSSYKNFDFFLISVANYLIENDFNIYCTGEHFSDREKTFIKAIRLENRVFDIGYVDDNKLANLYYNALCFVYPSLYEGFGIPILEAFKHQCPVCLSNSSCFPEIAQDAAIYFDPKDSKSIIDGIHQTISQREILIEKGKIRVMDFSWDKATYETEKVYNWVMNIK